MATARGSAVRVRAPAKPAVRPRPPARPHLQVAPDVRRRRRRARILVVAAGAVTVASLFALVAFHVLAAQSAFTAEHLAKQRANEQLRYERLRDEVARLSSPASVIAAAEELGMKPASREVFINVPQAAPRAGTSSQVPDSLGSKSYDTTKAALDQNP